MIDNLQGHSAYAVDALLTQRMNFRPGGKQAWLHDGWFKCDGERVTQPMIFPHDHPKFPDQPKGMKQILVEHGLWKNSLQMECKTCAYDVTGCCAKHILDLQPDFKEQSSLVKEVITQAGHLCIFLPKFHCDYTFKTLQENMPKALGSVGLDTIWKWEHRMVQWMEAYRSGLGAKEAQFHVKAFSSKLYKSHCCVPEAQGIN